jgi:hypothetical protein
LGTLLGTHGAFFARTVQKTEGERDKATVFLTVASTKNIFDRALPRAIWANFSTR